MLTFELTEKYTEKFGANRAERYLDAMLLLVAVDESNGTIRNAEYKEAMDCINRAVDQVWEWHVQDQFTFCGKWATLSKEEYELECSFMVSGLYNIPAAKKRIIKSKLNTPMTDAMLEVIAEFEPICEIVAKLKAGERIVKGRKPREEPVETNPNKIVKTCAVCFRAIALETNGTMVHHGYKRPHQGGQTQSCQGIRFQCLEVSFEGLVWAIQYNNDWIAKYHAAILEAPKLTQVPNPEYNLRYAMRLRDAYKVPVVLMKGEIPEADWFKLIDRIVRGHEQNIAITESDNAHRQSILDNWQPGKGLK